MAILKARRIREHVTLKHIALIAMTGYATDFAQVQRVLGFGRRGDALIRQSAHVELTRSVVRATVLPG